MAGCRDRSKRVAHILMINFGFRSKKSFHSFNSFIFRGSFLDRSRSSQKVCLKTLERLSGFQIYSAIYNGSPSIRHRSLPSGVNASLAFTIHRADCDFIRMKSICVCRRTLLSPKFSRHTDLKGEYKNLFTALISAKRLERFSFLLLTWFMSGLFAQTYLK